jgi:hypothetical protein
MPDVEWLSLNGRKHIVWVGRSTHEIGTLREMNHVEATELRQRYRGRGAVAGRRPTTIIVRTGEVKQASDLFGAALQTSPQVLPGMPAFRFSTDNSEVLVVADSNFGSEIEFIPVVKVADVDEAVNRMRAIRPDMQLENFEADKKFTFIRLPGGIVIALE